MSSDDFIAIVIARPEYKELDSLKQRIATSPNMCRWYKQVLKCLNIDKKRTLDLILNHQFLSAEFKPMVYEMFKAIKPEPIDLFTQLEKSRVGHTRTASDGNKNN